MSLVYAFIQLFAALAVFGLFAWALEQFAMHAMVKKVMHVAIVVGLGLFIILWLLSLLQTFGLVSGSALRLP